VWWGSYLDEWPVVFRESDTMLLRYLNLSTAAGGRADAVGWLSNRYDGNVSALNTAWHINALSFDTIARELPFLLPSEVRVTDEHAYMVRVATYYFAQVFLALTVCTERRCSLVRMHACVHDHTLVMPTDSLIDGFDGCAQVHSAVRAVDKNHLILGTRYSFLEMPCSVVTAEAPYTDVTSYNGYLWLPEINITTTVRKVSWLPTTNSMTHSLQQLTLDQSTAP
jgi:hypothetical protein